MAIFLFTTKVCRRCKIPKPLFEFTIKRSARDGLQTYCRDCKKIISKPLNERWHLEHPTYDAERYLANREDRIEVSSQWNRDNPERQKENTYRWNDLNPERKRAHVRASGHRRRVKLRSGTVEKFLDWEIFERDGWMCGLCQESIDSEIRWPDPLSVSLDHVIPVSKGGAHTRQNVQAAHLKCNLEKSARITCALPESMLE